jgi:hypothetical protein
MAKEYKLKTITDIENVVTPENIECFKKDFCSWLDILVATRKGFMGIPVIIKSDGVFTWIDDGKNDATIKIRVE